MRKYLVGLAVVALTVGVTTAAPAPADALTGQSDVQKIIQTKTGNSAAKVTAEQSVGNVGVGVGRSHGTALNSYAQKDAKTARMMAVIKDASQSTVDYAVTVPKGAEVKAQPDGSLAVIRANEDAPNVEVFGTFAASWATDAAGKSLPTTYSYKTGVLTQQVNTEGATFPVVADPYWRSSFYIVPVIYVQWTRSETNYINTHLTLGNIFSGALCYKLGAFWGTACGTIAAIYIWDIQRNVDVALSVSYNCLKQRIPANGSALALTAYDSYVHKCVTYA